MKYLILLLFQVALLTPCFSQFKNISIHAGANQTFIPSVETKSTFTLEIPYSSSYGYYAYTDKPGSIKESFKGETGFNIGGRTDITLSKKFFLTTGLNIQYLRFKRSTQLILNENNSDSPLILPGNFKIYDEGVNIGSTFGSINYWGADGEFTPRIPVGEENIIVIGNTDNMGKTTALYLELPVLIGTTMLKNKISIRGGLNFSYLLTATEYQLEYSMNVIDDRKVSTRDGYTKLLASGMMMLSYHPIKKLSIDFSGNTYLSPIFDTTNSPSKKAKYNTLSLDVSYTLLNR